MTIRRDVFVRCLTAFALLAVLAPRTHAQVFDYDLQGASSGNWFGIALNPIGDLDLDGCDDYVVGALGTTVATPFDGQAIVYSGNTGAAIATVSGNSQSDLGCAVDGRIDSDGDGHPDVLIGAFRDGTAGYANGRVMVFSPHRNKILLDLYGTVGTDYLGFSVRSLVGDIDGDGVNDFIAGAPGILAAYVYSGATGTLLYTKTGQSGSGFGTAVSNAGDMNGDGIHDFLIGAPTFVNSSGKVTGRVTAWSGKDGSQLWATNGADDSYFGDSLAHVGDLDGDGVEDCIVGAPIHVDPSGIPTGAAIVLSGASGAALYKLYGDQTNDWFGLSVQSELGDIDQDGTKDFIVGAPSDSSTGAPGYARLFSGATGSVLFTYGERTSDPTQKSSYGSAVAGGDVNGDGRNDVVIGGFSFDNDAGIVETWITAVAKGFIYGNGWPGTNGVPLLTTVSNPVVGQSLSLSLQDSSSGNTAGLLLIGIDAAAIPTGKGGTLLVAPLLSVPVSIPAGGLTLTGSIPGDPSLYGFNLYLQALELDAGASKGVSFTPGLDLYFGFA